MKKREKNVLGKIKRKNNSFDFRKVIVIILLFSILGVLGISFIKKDSPQEVTVVDLGVENKEEIGRKLMFMNSIVVKSLQEAEQLKSAIVEYENNNISFETLRDYILESKKVFTFLYFTNLTLKDKEELEDIPEDFRYNLYLLRRSSEELIKFVEDKSSLRLKVGFDLLDKAKQESSETIQDVVLKMASYDIDANKVSIDQLIWEKLEQYKSGDREEFIVFEDIETNNRKKYSDYIEVVNDGLFLISWEFEEIHKNKNRFISGELTQKQLNRKIEFSQYTINLIIDQMTYLEVPDQLRDSHKDLLDALVYYKDGIKTIEKFIMTSKVDYFDDGTELFKLGNEKSDKSLQFIRVLRNKFGF